MYYFVHSAFSTLKSYYSTHSPRFLQRLERGLVQKIAKVRACRLKDFFLLLDLGI